ncbi:tripartite tricarboxylate transporter substrate binding protein [soil metagenome]
MFTTTLRSVMLRTVAMTGLAIGLAIGASQSFAQGYPNRPIKLISPFPPGGQTDIVARLVAQPLSEVLGQPVIVEPKVGGNGVVGTANVKKAANDGYTLLIANAGLLTIAGSFDPDLPYNVARDFTPVYLVAGSPSVINVTAKLPVKTLAELVSLAKREPGKLNYGGVSPDSFSGLLLEQFRLQAFRSQATAGEEPTSARPPGAVGDPPGGSVRVPAYRGANIPEWTTISYKGSGTKIADLVSGQIDFTIDNVSSSIEYIKSGQFRPLVVSRKSDLLPDVPTFKEAGFDIQDALAWHGILAPAGTPREVVARLNTEIGKIVKRPEVAKKFHELGLEVLGGTPAEFDAHIRSETVRWTKVLKEAGIGKPPG